MTGSKQGDDNCRQDMYFGSVKSFMEMFKQKCHCKCECLFDFSVQVCFILHSRFPFSESLQEALSGQISKLELVPVI